MENTDKTNKLKMQDLDRTTPSMRMRKELGMLQAGDVVLNRYELLKKLGSGAMGVVFLCLDKKSGEQFALKMVPAELAKDESVMENILANFRLVHNLHHPNIASVEFLDTDEYGRYFLIMEYAEGQNLASLRRQSGGTLPVEKVIVILKQLAAALDYAHSEKIMHRDIKPANVMISSSGEVKLLDFGLASEVRTSMISMSIQATNTSGTPNYMAPELFRGQYPRPVSDQYALAVMIYELLSGHLPFGSSNFDMLRSAVINETPEKIDNVPEYINHALQKAMTKDPKERFASCTDFANAMERGKMVLPAKKNNNKITIAIFSLIAGFILIGCAAVGCCCWQKYKAKLEDLEKARLKALKKQEIDAPKKQEIDASKKQEIDAPKKQEIDAPKKQEIDAPKKQEIDAPKKQEIDAPKKQEIDVPKKQEIDAPKKQEIDVPKKQEIDAPKKQEIDAPKKQEIDAPKKQGIELQKEKPAVLEKEKLDAPEKQEPGLGKGKRQQADEYCIAMQDVNRNSWFIRFTNGVTLEMVKVEAGSFTMSKKDGDNYKDEVEHSATLAKDFYIGKTEVTQAQWKAIMGDNPSKFSGDNLPVEQVSWHDAMKFCKELNEQTEGKRPAGYRYTLPTETQWEYACRGGNRSKGYKYSGSDKIDEVAWYYNNSSQKTHEVGKKKANELGLHDMSGNVEEWCLDDWHENSGYAKVKFNRDEDPSDTYRIGRGGGWDFSAEGCRSASRSSGSPDGRGKDLGFRLVLVPEDN